ncbi:MAG: FHA domain-containing protein [Anaerolineae bacterium]|nr:FHA domain-containing protein [Anaerolineae bacterium]
MSEIHAYLVDQEGRRFPIHDAGLRLGRSPRCDLVIPDRRVSRKHAEIRLDDEQYLLADLDSANGTYLNGQRLTEAQSLHPGDAIAVGGAIFHFHDPDATMRESAIPSVVFDARSGELWVDRQPVALSAKEHALFTLLYRRRGHICSKPQIARHVWPEYQAPARDYQIESLVKRLREKIEADPRQPTLILTVRGQGYKLGE